MLLKVLHELHLVYRYFPDTIMWLLVTINYTFSDESHFPANNLNFYDIILLYLVNFPLNSHVLRRFLPIEFAFSYLRLPPITSWFLVKNLHFITYSAHAGRSPDRQQPFKKPTLLCPRESLWNKKLFSSAKVFSLFRQISSFRGYWGQNRVSVYFL